MMQQYPKKVIQEVMHPKNMGEIKNPDGVGEIGNPMCGDVLKVYIKVDKNYKGQEYIKEIKFQTFGCFAAIASSSMTTQIAKGKTLEEAEKPTMNDVINELGELPKIKMHCSSMAIQGLRKAIKNCRENRRENKHDKKDDNSQK